MDTNREGGEQLDLRREHAADFGASIGQDFAESSPIFCLRPRMIYPATHLDKSVMTFARRVEVDEISTGCSKAAWWLLFFKGPVSICNATFVMRL
jgi:hypothetical protein